MRHATHPNTGSCDLPFSFVKTSLIHVEMTMTWESPIISHFARSIEILFWSWHDLEFPMRYWDFPIILTLCWVNHCHIWASQQCTWVHDLIWDCPMVCSRIPIILGSPNSLLGTLSNPMGLPKNMPGYPYQTCRSPSTSAEHPRDMLGHPLKQVGAPIMKWSIPITLSATQQGIGCCNCHHGAPSLSS